MRVVASYSIKGGVGKTTTAVNLAYEAARAGTRVLVWDLDPQGAATYLLRVRARVKGGSRRLVGDRGELAGHVRDTDVTGVHVVPADFSLRHLDLHLERTATPTTRLARLLGPLDGRYDLVLLDCPPNISRASEAIFEASDLLVVPVVPATLAGRALDQLAELFEAQPGAPEVVPLLSMLDRRRRLHRELAEALVARWPGALPTPVPAAAVVERMGVERAPVGAFAARSSVARAYAQVWAELAERLWPA